MEIHEVEKHQDSHAHPFKQVYEILKKQNKLQDETIIIATVIILIQDVPSNVG